MRNKLFQTLDTEKRSVFVARQILDLLRRGVLSVGDKLPTESQICEETGVSRPSVREAIVALELLGIVERRAGAGTFVISDARSASINGLLNFLTSVFREGDTPLHLMGARQAIEVGALYLWDFDPAQEDLEKLETLVAEMKEAVENRDAHRYFELDMEFHRHLAGIVGNPVIQSIMNSLIAQMEKQTGWIEALQRYPFNRHEGVMGSFRLHVSILEALKSGKKEQVFRLLEEHYDQTPWWRGVRQIHSSEAAN